jgi:type IV pilus assembly protein PilX
MKHREPSNAARQSGAALIVSLLLLLVLTVLGIVMMQTSRMQERMAGNTRDLNLAVQGAEGGLRYGEAVVAAYADAPVSVGTIPCTVCQQGTLPVAIYDPAQFNWLANATAFGTGGVAGAALAPPLSSEPLYTIEEAGFAPYSLNTGTGESDGRAFYQITSYSTGLSGNATTVLQSTYARTF